MGAPQFGAVVEATEALVISLSWMACA